MRRTIRCRTRVPPGTGVALWRHLESRVPGFVGVSLEDGHPLVEVEDIRATVSAVENCVLSFSPPPRRTIRDVIEATSLAGTVEDRVALLEQIISDRLGDTEM